MKNLPGNVAPFVAIAKSNLSGWYILLALLLLSVLSGCEKEDIAVCPEPQITCEVEVTAEQVMCGYGAFRNVWLKSAEGKYLQPWYNATGQKELTPGQKYKIGFSVVERDDKYNDVVTCMAAVPESQAVAILCLSPATSNN